MYGTDYPEPVDLDPTVTTDLYDEAGQIIPDEPDAGGWHRGQARFAFLLAQHYAGRLLHVHGLGWMAYDGKRWVEDTGQAKRAVLKLLRTGWRAAQTNKDLEQDVRKCESAAGIAGVLDIASALTAFSVTVRDLNPDPYLLNCANGTLDLRTMELRSHDPADRITKVTGASYDPDAAGREWDKFLTRVLPDQDTRDFLRRYVGLALCGRVLEHILAILTGTGRNGKGVFYGAVAAALGDYASTAEPDLFMHRDGAHPTGEMDLLGLRWVVVSESDQGRRLAEATVKRLTGGDEIKARRMRQDFVAFTPSHTAALVTNHLPKVSGDDPALWARLRVVPFDVVIPKKEQDPHLTEKLSLEASAVLSWAVAGWTDYTQLGLAEPDSVLKATADYHADADDIARFIEQECFVNAHSFVNVGALWERWCSWRIDEGAQEISKKAFGLALDGRGFTPDKSRGQRIRRGITLQNAEENQESRYAV